eukprot:3941248-Rhodomonas_salina.2
MSGTDLAHGAIGLRVCCTMSGTDLADGCTRRDGTTRAVLAPRVAFPLPPYAMPAVLQYSSSVGA